MKIKTLKDVLHWTKEFHQHLSDCLSLCATKNTDERARMVLNYLAEQEKNLAEVVGGFEASSSEDALNTWCYEYVNQQTIIQHDYCDAPFADLDADQIMEVVVDQHQQVIDLYHYLSARANIPSAQEMLESISSLEDHEMMRMMQSANRFGDM